MNDNPINLALRFLLELVALLGYGYWGWTTQTGWKRAVLVIGLPLLAAVIWGTFRVDGDPNEAPVAIAGWARLVLEAVFFGLAVVLLRAAHQPRAALILGAIVLIHYLISYDRVLRLLQLDS